MVQQQIKKQKNSKGESKCSEIQLINLSEQYVFIVLLVTFSMFENFQDKKSG